MESNNLIETKWSECECILCVFWKMFQSLNYIAPHCVLRKHYLFLLLFMLFIYMKRTNDNATQKITHIGFFSFSWFSFRFISLFLLSERWRGGDPNKKNRLDYVFVFLFAICGSWKNDGDDIRYFVSHDCRHMCWHLYTIQYIVRMDIDVCSPCPTHSYQSNNKKKSPHKILACKCFCTQLTVSIRFGFIYLFIFLTLLKWALCVAHAKI